MAESKRIHRFFRLFSDDRATEASPLATERVQPSKGILNSKKPVRNRLHRLYQSSAAKHSLPSQFPYQYTRLKDNRKEIRLLTLHEGDFEADLNISIHTAPLTPDNIPTYEALSYVWGSQENPIDIHVGLHTLAVTQNLAEALPYLRYRDKPRTLWIDAICVNQHDLKERSRQVRRMADLYRLADRVVVWLGPEKADSKYGLRLLQDLSSKVTVDWVHDTMEPMSNGAEKHWADVSEELPFGDKELSAICSLINCPWFERLWVWQEIFLAKPNAMMICGLNTIPWESFRTAIFCLYSKLNCIKQISVIYEQFRGRVISIYPLANSEQAFSFEGIMDSTRHCKYTDPKDRIYAILSLLESSGEAINIEPDYTKRTSHVYQDVTLRYINQRRSLRILLSSGLNERSSEMPTWVPDWTVVDTPVPIVNAFASGHIEQQVQHRGGGILSVTGRNVTTVEHVDRIQFRDQRSCIAEIQRLAPQDVLHGSYIGNGSLLTAYCITLCDNLFSENYSPRTTFFPQFQQSLDFLSGILQPGINQVPNPSRGTQAESYIEYVWSVCRKRSFVKTREGYIGLAPQNAQVGDQVCVLLGCEMPMLLRSTSKSQHQVIGPCYVHGLMDGEGLLGPLPGHFQRSVVFEEPLRKYFSGFLDRRTGKTQYNDPRNDSLPEDDSGEAAPTWEFPGGSRGRRVTPKMIERRGVKLQTFDLI